MEWIVFAVGVTVIAVIGIVVGLALGRAVAKRGARRDGESDSFTTPVGPAGAGDESAASGGGNRTGPDATATDGAVGGDEHD